MLSGTEDVGASLPESGGTGVVAGGVDAIAKTERREGAKWSVRYGTKNEKKEGATSRLGDMEGVFYIRYQKCDLNGSR